MAVFNLDHELYGNSVVFGTEEDDSITNGYIGSHGNSGANYLSAAMGARIIAKGGNDTIKNTPLGNIVYLDGGQGNDVIINLPRKDHYTGYRDAYPDGVTICGGEGNDTIEGAVAIDVLYHEGDGDDFIKDYDSGTLIHLLSADLKNASLYKSSVILKVGTGSLTLQNAKDKEITIITSEDKIIKFTNTYGEQNSSENNSQNHSLDNNYSTSINQFEDKFSEVIDTNKKIYKHSTEKLRAELEKIKNNFHEGIFISKTDEISTSITKLEKLNESLDSLTNIDNLQKAEQIGEWIETATDIIDNLKKVEGVLNIDAYNAELSRFEGNLNYYLNNVFDLRDDPVFKQFEEDNYRRTRTPQQSDYIENLTGYERIQKIHASNKSLGSKIVAAGRIVNESSSSVRASNIWGNLSHLEKAGVVLSLANVVQNFYNSRDSIAESWNQEESANLGEKILNFENNFKELHNDEYDKINVSLLDACGALAGCIAGVAAGPGILTGLAVSGLVMVGTATAKTLYYSSQHEDTDFWKTFVNNLNPFSDDGYVPKNLESSYDLVYYYSADIIDNVTVIYGSTENDSLINTQNYKLISGNDGNDIIINRDFELVTISGGNGDDSIINANSSNTTIYGNDGNDSISNWANNVEILGGNGHNTIRNFDSKEILITTADGDDYIDNAGDFNAIRAGDGNNIIDNIGAGVSIISGQGADTIDNLGINVHINSGMGDDYISTEGDNVTIQTGEGNDSVKTVDSSKVFIELYEGENYVESFGDLNTINAGNNEDVINSVGDNNFINLNTGNDYVEIFGDSNTIDSGAGSNYILSVGYRNFIYGGTNDNIIEIFGDSNTINAGIGNDYINVDGSNNVIECDIGNSNDTITGLDLNNLLIVKESYTTIKSGKDVILNGDAGSVTLKDIVDISSIIIQSSQSPSTIEILQKSSEGYYNYTGGHRTVANYSPNEKINLSSDVTGISFAGNNFVINSSSGALTLENVRGKVIDVSLGDGNTAAYAYMASGGGDIPGTLLENVYEVIVGSEIGQNNIIAGNAGSSLISGGGNNTLTSGAGSDFMKGGSGQDTFVYTGGYDVVANYQSGEILNFSASYTGWTSEGNDLVINAAEGSVRVQEATNKLVEFAIDNNVIAHVYKAEGYEGALDGRSFGGFEVIVGSDNQSNQLYSNEVGSSLWGGRGNSNDDLYGGAGSDEFIYSYGNGQDNIFNVGLEDSVNLLNVSLDQIASAQITDNGVTAQFNDGGALNINGQSGRFKLGGQTFHADYQNKIWS